MINEKRLQNKIILEFIHHPRTHAKEKRCTIMEYPSKVSQPLNKQDKKCKNKKRKRSKVQKTIWIRIL